MNGIHCRLYSLSTKDYGLAFPVAAAVSEAFSARFANTCANGQFKNILPALHVCNNWSVWVLQLET